MPLIHQPGPDDVATVVPIHRPSAGLRPVHEDEEPEAKPTGYDVWLSYPEVKAAHDRWIELVEDGAGSKAVERAQRRLDDLIADLEENSNRVRKARIKKYTETQKRQTEAKRRLDAERRTGPDTPVVSITIGSVTVIVKPEAPLDQEIRSMTAHAIGEALHLCHMNFSQPHTSEFLHARLSDLFRHGLSVGAVEIR